MIPDEEIYIPKGLRRNLLHNTYFPLLFDFFSDCFDAVGFFVPSLCNIFVTFS